ncbi:hypothetical protein SAMN05421512_11664 [Stappia indica]|uniref:Uncharacterized protein n=1 Tax=Stappia indica TaxID=538381 RepID=A0A285TWW6_9HYPH|nr:hypothetical protein SAMN05421512_11664 [Stappia indica]
MLHQPGLSLVRKTSAAHVSLSSIFDCQRTERKPSQPKHQNKQVPAPLRVKTRKPSVSGDGDSERRRCFPAPPSLLMGLYAPPPRTVKPPPQKKSNQPKKPTQPTHHPWGKPTQQHNKTKQNQHSNNMHRQTNDKRVAQSAHQSNRPTQGQIAETRRFSNVDHASGRLRQGPTFPLAPPARPFPVTPSQPPGSVPARFRSIHLWPIRFRSPGTVAPAEIVSPGGGSVGEPTDRPPPARRTLTVPAPVPASRRRLTE